MMNCELKKILVAAARVLLDQKLISTPCQIAISEYNPKEKWGKYLIFCVDVSPFEEFTHIILSNYEETINQYKSNLEAFSKKYDAVRDERLKLRNYRNAIVRNSYDVLRNIMFEEPLVLSGFYSKCKKEKDSQQNVDLFHNPVYTGPNARSLDWELGCFLERQLFSANDYPNFSSTFFAFNENAYDKNNNTTIYSISVFNRAREGEKILKGQKEIVKLIEENNKAALLEDVLDKIPDSEPSESVNFPPPADLKEEIT